MAYDNDRDRIDSATDHIRAVLAFWKQFVTVKYWKGQVEHGGDLWTKAGMLHHVEQEAADIAVYLATLRLQLTKVAEHLNAQHYEAASDLLESILGDAEE
ncbi:MAG TPA: hypothetical protein VMY35_11455 [Phycisphaerae bacterium]|nr:hypothetical protein [Phycisphaerae bacterium]